jgi:hypothetical protein
MKASLAISSRKIVAILLLLAALVIALYLSGLVYPNPVSDPLNSIALDTTSSNPPLDHTKTEMLHLDPKPMVIREHVENQMDATNPIPLKKPVSNYKPATDVFDQLFSTASPNETFSIPTVSSMK